MAVIDKESCRPHDCDVLCYRVCPEVRMKSYAITFHEGEEKPTIVEDLCTGCGICIHKCPFDAISIVNLPQELDEECSHRYGENTFKLFRLPTPAPGKVTGLLGMNGVGKTTALRILSGEVKPNLGRYDSPPGWDEVLRHFRGSTLQAYFQRLRDGRLKVVHKPQHIDAIPRRVRGTVGEVLRRLDERDKRDVATRLLELEGLLDRPVEHLSGGECQRLAVASALCREADVYIFDEPSSYLDVRQRLNAAKAIRGLAAEGKTVLVAEHDIAVLDYLSDQVCLLYGEPGVFGIVSDPHGVRAGINLYLDGYLPEHNMRFREEPIRFHVKPPAPDDKPPEPLVTWTALERRYDGFALSVEAGELRVGEVAGVLGPNGIGKTTFLKLLAGVETPDRGAVALPAELAVSYKPQYVSPDQPGTVRDLLATAAGARFHTSHYQAEILRPLRLEKLLDRAVSELSGGELQKVAVAACLSRGARLYLLDEPSAFLDVEERLAVARTVRRLVEASRSAAVVVEHDVVALDFLSDCLIPFLGEPGAKGEARAPTPLREGMNAVLRRLGVTFRRDLASGRPRVNKEGSRLDRRQKDLGEYYYVPTHVQADTED